MTEQPNEQTNNNQPTSQIEKLLIDDSSNFQFHAAYLVYSETFDAVTDAQAKQELNQNLEDLKSNKIDYETFYVNISRYRKTRSAMPRQGKIHVADSAKERLANENSKIRANKKTQKIKSSILTEVFSIIPYFNKQVLNFYV